jgi:rubredoxin
MRTDFYENKRRAAPRQRIRFWVCPECHSHQHYTHETCTQCGYVRKETKRDADAESR